MKIEKQAGYICINFDQKDVEHYPVEIDDFCKDITRNIVKCDRSFSRKKNEEHKVIGITIYVIDAPFNESTINELYKKYFTDERQGDLFPGS